MCQNYEGQHHSGFPSSCACLDAQGSQGREVKKKEKKKEEEQKKKKKKGQRKRKENKEDQVKEEADVITFVKVIALLIFQTIQFSKSQY